MGSWHRSSVTNARLQELMRGGLLCPKTEAVEWRVPGDERDPSPLEGYIVSFLRFHERGLSVPPHQFLRGLLHYYQIELQHLNPNGIQHIAGFVALCKCYLGIPPNFKLWKYLFAVTLLWKEGRTIPIGSTGISLRGERASEYMAMKQTSSNRGWHQEWFYLKNDFARPFPAFTGVVLGFDEASTVWRYGPVEKEKWRITDLLNAIVTLKSRGLRGARIVGAYHARRVIPLMARRLPLYSMTADADPAGTLMSTEQLPLAEVRRCIKQAMWRAPGD